MRLDRCFNFDLLRTFLLTAPIMMRNISHRNPNNTINDVGVCLGNRRMENSGHKKVAKNPVSNI